MCNSSINGSQQADDREYTLYYAVTLLITRVKLQEAKG